MKETIIAVLVTLMLTVIFISNVIGDSYTSNEKILDIQDACWQSHLIVVEKDDKPSFKCYEITNPIK